MQRKNYDVSLQIQFTKEFLNKQEGHEMINALLLQYPYGMGGMTETRVQEDGLLTNKVDTCWYLRHLSLLSEHSFQAPMFQLIMYSLYSKAKLLSKSRLHLRGKQTAESLAQGFAHSDLESALRGRERGDRHSGTRAVKTLLSAVNACSVALPHTNEASRCAKGSGEAMQHHFGTGCIFLTVSFDDEHSFLIQVLTGVIIDDNTPVENLSNDELAKQARLRKELQINHPGAGSIHFEMLLNILCEEVIGWDMRKGCPMDKIGLFGKCIALSVLHLKSKAGNRYMVISLFILRVTTNFGVSCFLVT
jgi:hypothetical protein